MELITSLMEGTVKYSDNYFYRLTAAYQNRTCFFRDETEGGALAPELTEKEIISRLFHSFPGSR